MKKIAAILVSVLVVLILMGTATVYFGWQWLISPVNPDSTETISVIIPKGSSITAIGQQLEEEGVIHHQLAFRMLIQRLEMENSIQAGTFEVSPAMTLQEVAEAMTVGTEDIWITLLEGWRNEEIAEYLAEQPLPAFDSELFLQIAEESEGMLYPDTYLVPRLIEAQGMHDFLLETYQNKVLEELSDDFASFGKDPQDILIMASIVQREARDKTQMQNVAGILWNRMDIGMALQVDASLQYVRGYDEREETWWPVPLGVDRELESEFNTYLNAGLPPAPICNPGFDAIEATLNPIDSDNIFYLHAPDGSIHYGQTLDQHNANIQRYLR